MPPGVMTTFGKDIRDPAYIQEDMTLPMTTATSTTIATTTSTTAAAITTLPEERSVSLQCYKPSNPEEARMKRENTVHFTSCELATSWPGYFEGAIDSAYRTAGEIVSEINK